MKTVVKLVKSLSVFGLGIALLTLPCLDAVNADPRSPRRSASQRNNGSSSTNLIDQVDTSGRDNVTQSATSRQQGAMVENSVIIQLNNSGCDGQNSNQSASSTRSGIGSSASASVSVCNPALRLRN